MLNASPPHTWAHVHNLTLQTAMNTAANPFHKSTFNLTLQCKLYKSNPTEARRLQAEAKADPGPISPRRSLAVPFIPGLPVTSFGPATNEPVPEPPAPVPPAPLGTQAVPTMDADLRTAILAAVATVTTARSSHFEGKDNCLVALATLAALPEAEDAPRVFLLPRAEQMLGNFAGVYDMPAACVKLAGRVAVLLHLARNGEADGNPTDNLPPLPPETVDLALVVADWTRRQSPPLAPSVPEPDPQPAPATVAAGETEADPAPETMPEIPVTALMRERTNAPEPNAEEPPKPAGGEPDARWQRLLDLLSANGGRLTMRQARRAGYAPTEVAALIAAHPGALTTATAAPAGKGGRPSPVPVRYRSRLPVKNTPAKTPAPAPAALLPVREPGEPGKWHTRFCSYALAGPCRSVDATWRAEQASAAKAAKTPKAGAVGAEGDKGQRAPGSWTRAAEAWRWRERADAFDGATLAAEAEELADQRRAERARRRALVSLFMGRAEKLVSDAHAFTASPAGVSVAVARAVELSRREFGSDPDPDADSEGGMLLLTAGPSAPIVNVIIEGAMPEEDPLPPPGEIEPPDEGDVV